MYVCSYKEQNNRKENRESFVMVPYKNKLGCITVTVLKYINCGMHTW